MQKFIHDNEQYVLEVKRKQGKTKIDKEIKSLFTKQNKNIAKSTIMYRINYKIIVSKIKGKL